MHRLDTSVERFIFFFQAEDGIRDLVRSRGLGDVYKRQGRGARVGAGQVDGGLRAAAARPAIEWSVA